MNEKLVWKFQPQSENKLQIKIQSGFSGTSMLVWNKYQSSNTIIFGVLEGILRTKISSSTKRKHKLCYKYR